MAGEIPRLSLIYRLRYRAQLAENHHPWLRLANLAELLASGS